MTKVKEMARDRAFNAIKEHLYEAYLRDKWPLTHWIRLLSQKLHEMETSFGGQNQAYDQHLMIRLAALGVEVMMRFGVAFRNGTFICRTGCLNDMAVVRRAIDDERDYQDSLGPDRTDGQPRSVSDYIAILHHYVEKCNDAWVTSAADDQCLHNFRKVVTICVCSLEEHWIE